MYTVQQAALHGAGRPLQYRRRARPLPRVLAAGRPQGGQPRPRPGHGSRQGGQEILLVAQAASHVCFK